MEFNHNALLTEITNYLTPKVDGFSLEEHQDVSFSSLGLDSLNHVELSTVIEEHLGKHIEPTFAFDYPTINALLNKLKTM